MTNHNLGKALREARERSGIKSRTELARRVGKREATLRFIENGRGTPSIELVHKLCKELGLRLVLGEIHSRNALQVKWGEE